MVYSVVGGPVGILCWQSTDQNFFWPFSGDVYKVNNSNQCVF